MLRALKRLFTPDPVKQQAHDAYLHIVTQARRPVFYADWKVDDTVDGRFDVILLHLFLVIARLEAETVTPRIQDFIRILSEVFFADMDRSLREMGSSDTGVGIRIKKMAQAFYGRLKAYSDSMDDDAAFAEALKRNAYREQPVADDAVSALAAYMQRNRIALRAQPAEALMQGSVVFTD